MVVSSSFSYVELRFLFALQSRHVFLAYRNFTRYEDIPSTSEHCIDLRILRVGMGIALKVAPAPGHC